MRQKSTFLIVLIFGSLLTFGQAFQKQFEELSQKNDTAGQAKLLTEWGVTSPKDAEFFIATFNFYAKKSMKEEISIEKNQTKQSPFALTDTGNGKLVAYLNSSIHFHSELLQKGFNAIDRVINLHPGRLDMRFGKIYMLGEAENFNEFTSEIIRTIEYGAGIKNAWLWKEGKPLEEPQKFFLSSLQNYIATIYNTENDSLLPLMRQISETAVKYYPDHVESLSNIALTYLVVGDLEKALPPLLKAEKVAPSDVIVLNNIAEAYKRKGDKANARLYFEKIMKYGSSEEIKDAKKRLQSL